VAPGAYQGLEFCSTPEIVVGFDAVVVGSAVVAVAAGLALVKWLVIGIVVAAVVVVAGHLEENPFRTVDPAAVVDP